MKTLQNKAFTLVELIVVITILAVLATVWFISLTGYATESRDTKRMTDIATISKWLQTYLAKNSQVPEPSETKTIVNYSGSQLLTQWYAWESVLNEIKVQDAKDPVDNTFYTYSTNASNTKFQLLWFLENLYTQNKANISKANADYWDRVIYTKWHSVWVLLDNQDYTPINITPNSDIDLETSSDVYVWVFTNKYQITGSGDVLKENILGAHKNLFGWEVFDQNCQLDDVIVWNQVWAWCNSTLWNWFEFWETLDATILYCYDYQWNDTWDCSNSSEMKSTSMAIDWNSDANENWDREYHNIWWKLYAFDDAESACPVWRKLPSDQDWSDLSTYINNSVVCDETTWWQCSGLWWKDHNKKDDTQSVASVLKIPLSWYRSTNGTTYYYRGYGTGLWSSTVEEWLSYYRYFRWNHDGILRTSNNPLYWFSVRCIKDT